MEHLELPNNDDMRNEVFRVQGTLRGDDDKVQTKRFWIILAVSIMAAIFSLTSVIIAYKSLQVQSIQQSTTRLK